MAEKWQVRLSGTGGQGIIRGAVLLAQAALYDGSNAVQSQVYGPEARGGATTVSYTHLDVYKRQIQP